MTTTYSGTTTWLATGKQICTRAAAKLLVIDTSNSEVLDTTTLGDFLFQLNAISKETMAAPGVIPWTTTMNTLFLQQSQVVYYLGSTTGYQTQDNWTNSYSYATLVNNQVATDTSIVITGLTLGADASTAGSITAGDFIGIKLNSGATWWDVVMAYSPTTKTVTLTNGLSGAASAGNYLYDYTTKADRPQEILQVARSNTSLIDNIIEPISLQVYNQLPNKEQNGMPIQWHYNSTIPNSELRIWQPYDGTSGWDRLSCWCNMIIEDFDAAGADNPYYPVEWANYLIWQLAAEMADEYELADTKIQRIQQTAMRKYDALLNYSAQLSKSPIQFGMTQNAWRMDSR